MLVRCETNDMASCAIQFIKQQKAEKISPYVYLNIMKYGARNDEVISWISIDGEGSIEAIYVLYYDCLHAFVPGADEKSFNYLAALVSSCAPRTVMLSGISDEINIPAFATGWLTDHNYVIDMDRVGIAPRSFISVLADDADIEAIADLMMADSYYIGVYERNNLVRQMKERFHDGFSRYVIIREGNSVAAACSTYGECDDLAIVGGVIVGPEYRRRGYASDIEGHICKSLEDEGKMRVAFVSTENTKSLALHKKLGGVKIGMIHKYVRSA